MHRVISMVLAAIAILCFAFLSAGCLEDPNATANSERKIRKGGYERLAAAQPASTMNYSPTRETINFWIKTWDKPGKLAYVYLIAANGEPIGYYVFRGPPVSMCAALTPTYDLHDSSNGNLMLPAPGVDGVYYSGGQCSAYYGRDATSNSYVEYTVGQGISALIYDRPLPRQDMGRPLGFTTLPKR